MKRKIWIAIALIMIPVAAFAQTGKRFNAYTAITESNLTDADLWQVWNGGNIKNISTQNLWDYLVGTKTIASFTGTTIPDASTVIASLQALESALELKQTADADLTYLAGVTLSDDAKGLITAANYAAMLELLGAGPTDNPSFNSLNVSGGNLSAANKQVVKAWQTDLGYTADVTAVVHGGKIYVCTSTHTAASATEPGVGASWETVWEELQSSGLASTDIDTSSELRAILSDESGTGALIFADGALGTPSFTALNMPSSDASPSTTAGQIRHDTVATGLTGGAVAWWNGSAVKYLVDLDTLPVTDDYVVAYDADADKFYMKSDATGAGYTNLTSFIDQTAWRLFYSDGSGDIKELALGADGEYLKSNGASLAPSWATPSGAAHDAITLSTDLGNNLLGLSTQQITLDNQNANIVFAGPSTGSAAAPSFRSLVAADIPSLATTYAVVTGTPETTFQIDNNASGPKLKFYDTKLEVKNAADDAYYDIRVKDIYAENINSTKADGAYYANFDNTVAITFTPSLGYIWSQSSGGVSTLYFYDGSGSRTVLNSNSTLDDDKVAFDDTDNLWTATTIGAALEELNDSINSGVPNGTGAKVHWSQLLGVPAGFADGTDDGGGFSPLTYDDLTWGAAAGGSQTWTWDTGSGTDPSLTISDTYFTFNKIIQCAGIETTRSATIGGSVRIGYEGSNNGDNYLDMKAPDSRSTSLTLLYPTADPSEGQAIAWSVPSTEVSTGTWYTPVKEGTATGGILLGDSSPDTAGEFGYASNQLSVHDGTASRDVLQVASTTITKTEYIPIAYAEDGSVAPSASAVTASTRKVRTREFSGTADNDVEIHWMVPLDYAGGVKFRFVGYVTNATAPANTEVVAFSLAGCSNGNNDVLGCTAGTAQTSSLTADANYVQYDRLTGAYSSAITITDIAAGESAHLKLTRLATTTDTYGQAFGLAGIEIKYQAKVNASGDY